MSLIKMKKIWIAIFMMMMSALYPQKLPQLNLRSSVDKNIEFPLKLSNNDICVIIHNDQAWSSDDTNTYYFFRYNGDIKIFFEETPKKYIKNVSFEKEIRVIALDDSGNSVLSDLIQSKSLIDFQQYDQSDFEFKYDAQKELPPQLYCMIHDSNGYVLTFIQNGKQNSYKYYAPKYYLGLCDNKIINKKVLGNYVELLDAFWSVKLFGDKGYFPRDMKKVRE